MVIFPEGADDGAVILFPTTDCCGEVVAFVNSTGGVLEAVALVEFDGGGGE